MDNFLRRYYVLATAFALALLVIVPSCGATAATMHPEALANAVPVQIVHDASAAATSIEGRHWGLLAMKTDEAMVPVLADRRPSLLLVGGEVSGSTGCNAYIGGYTVDREHGSVSFFGLMYTLMWCEEPPGIMGQEGIYVRLLDDVAGYERNGDALRLLNGEGETILLYGELPPVAYLPVVCQ